MTSKISSRYLAETFIVVVFSYIVFAGIFFYLTNEYAYNDQRARMESLASSVHTASSMLLLSDSAGNRVVASGYIDVVAKGSGLEVVVVDTTGRVILTSETVKSVLTSETAPMPSYVMEPILQGARFEGAGTLDAFFSEERYVMGFPIYTGDHLLGASFFVAIPQGGSKLIRELIRLFSTASFAVLALTMVVIYFTSNKMAKPLRGMAVAAKSFGQGNFDTRVEVHGEDEMAELATAFNNMAASLEKNEEMRRSFIANVSHDLKTPMTIIAGFVDGIVDGTITSEEAPHYLGLVRDEVRRLSRLVNTLLDLARLEAGEAPMKCEPFDLCETVRQVLISFEKVIGEKKLGLNVTMANDTIMAKGDADAVHRVIYNLLDNGIKFTPKNGEIHVSVLIRDRNALCSLRNTGDGVPAADLPHLFDRFYKSDKSRSLDKKGSGLGLYIAKTIVERLGGIIRAESVLGENCTFTFTLPLAKK